MTEKPRTFDIKFDSAGDFDKARELIERMNAALAAKDRRIAELEKQIVALNHYQKLSDQKDEIIQGLQAQIDRVRALAEDAKRRSEIMGMQVSINTHELLAVLSEPATAKIVHAGPLKMKPIDEGEPAATPERKQP